AGLLDLGYVAFFGFGAYLYGIMASGHSGHHLQAGIAIPIVVVATALLGLVLGLTSWRLLGDYLAIVTLFFLQAFVIFVNNANGGPSDFSYPFVGRVDLTGGANGLDQIDPLNFFGHEITTTKGYYLYTLAALTLLMTMLFFVNKSRTGRSWRALREDPLAAEVMTVPVNRLKLLAFMFGAATAGFTGTIFGAVQSGAFPGDYDVGLLITIYAIVILGGLGRGPGRGRRCIRAGARPLGPHPDTCEPPRRLGVFRAHRRGAPAHARPRLVAHDPPDPDALSGGVRLGEQARRAGFGCDATDHARRTPRCDHERAALRDLRDVARGDRLTVALLELRGVSKAFGGLQVVNDLDLHVGEGEIVSVIGPNGAGKTTVFNLITGIFRPDSGSIVFEGGVVSGLPPHTITTRGIARTFQTLRLFLNMTVLENVMVAAYGHTRSTIV